MGKLTDWKTEREAERQKQIDNNILTNPDAWNCFLENIEDLDFNYQKIDLVNFKLKVRLSESAIKYPKKEDYPYIVYLELHSDTNEVSVSMGQHTKTFNNIECDKLLTLFSWLLEDSEKVPTENLMEKFTEKNRKGPISWG